MKRHGIGIAVPACAATAWAAPDWTRAVVVKVDPEKAQVTPTHQRIRFTLAQRHDHLVVGVWERAP